MQCLQQIGLQPQRRHRQIQDDGVRIGGQEAAGTESGPGPGQRQSTGHGQPVAQTKPIETLPQIREQGTLAAEQVAAASDVDGQPIGAIDHHPRAVAAAPQAQRFQLVGIGGGLGVAESSTGQIARASASARPGVRLNARPAGLTAVSRGTPRSVATSASGASAGGNGLPVRRALSRMRWIGHSGSQSEM